LCRPDVTNPNPPRTRINGIWDRVTCLRCLKMLDAYNRREARDEARAERHREEDPHCTCPDCILHHAATTDYEGEQDGRDRDRTMRAKLHCSICGCDLKHVGSCGIVDYENRWDAQADRYDCPEGHTLLVVESDRLVSELRGAVGHAEGESQP
jgi:hypothetical protein